MIHAELIYETGSKSVACYASEAELLEAVQAHHDRAKAGQAGGPPGHPAERVVEVQVYDKHPADLNANRTMSVDVLKKELDAVVKEASHNGVVEIPELMARVRDIDSPLVADVEGQQVSMYKMEATKTLKEGDKTWQ